MQATLKLPTLICRVAVIFALTLWPIVAQAHDIGVQHPATYGPGSVSNLAKKLQNAVVNISTSVVQPTNEEKETPEFEKGSPFEELFRDFFEGGGKPPKIVNSLGSGFVADASGIIVTNHHVIQDADDIFVNFQDGRKLKVVKLLGMDEKTDIAVLKVEPKKPLNAVTFGSSRKLNVGDWAMAIGNPFGLGGSVSVGVISAKNRDINAGPFDNFIQTDAAINKGNSGGPLFNMHGELVGINTAIISPSGGSIGIGFAVPSDTASHVINQLVKHGEVRRGWMGVHLQTLSNEIAKSLGMDAGYHGALIARVTKNSPAEKAGLKIGDIVLKFNNDRVRTMRQLPRLIAGAITGKPCSVDILRNGKKMKVSVILDYKKKEKAEVVLKAPLPVPPTTQNVKKRDMLGLELKPLNKPLRKKHRIKKNVKGVLIIGVEKGSRADKKLIEKGHVVVEVSQQAVTTPEDIQKQIDLARSSHRKSILLLLANPKGELRFVAVPLG